MRDRRRVALSVSLAQLLAAAALTVLLVGVGHFDTVIFGLLFAFALIGDRLEVDTKVVTISGAFLAVGLAMVLLGPVPPPSSALATMVLDSVRRRPPVHSVASNIATFTVFPLVGGWLIDAVGESWNIAQADVNYALLVIGVFIVANGLNFLQVALTHRIVDGVSIWHATRSSTPRCSPRRSPSARSPPASSTPTPMAAASRSACWSASSSSTSTCCASCCSPRSAPSSSARGPRSSPRCRSACSPRCSRRCRCATR